MLLKLQQSKQTQAIQPYLLGMLLTMYQKNTQVSNAVKDALHNSYGNLVFGSEIDYRTEAKKAALHTTAWLQMKSQG